MNGATELSTGLLAYTLFHVALSLIGIATGLVVLKALRDGRSPERATAWFLATTTATSVTGFFFPNLTFSPAVKVGILSMLLLAIAIWARYGVRLTGRWRTAYVATGLTALYLNVFVLVAQLFQKVPALHALAPKGNEPPFAIAQGLVLVVFLALGVSAWRRFRGAPPAAAPA